MVVQNQRRPRQKNNSYHCVYNRCKRTLFDEGLVSVHPTVDVRWDWDHAKGTVLFGIQEREEERERREKTLVQQKCAAVDVDEQ